MTRLLKTFLDIALWRKTPAALPVSAFLLTLVAGADALLEAVQDWWFPDRQHVLFNMVVAVAAPLCFTWAALALTKKRHRFLQTGSAVLGIDALVGLLFLPLEAAARAVGPNSSLAPVFALLVYAGLIAYLIANMNVWRAALDTGLISAGLISLGYVVMQLLLGQESA
jgi:hypothetical protein